MRAFDSLTTWRGLTAGMTLVIAAWAVACGESMTEVLPPPPPNRTPVAVGTIPAQTMASGESIAIDVSDYFDDPDGDVLTYGTRSTDPSRVSASVAGANVTIAGVADGMATVTVIATDPGGLQAAQSAGVTVQSGNRPPQPVGSIPAQNVSAGTSVTVDVAVYFDDPEGDTLTYEASSSNTRVAAVTVAGSDVIITGISEGSADVTVVATDPDGRSAEQVIDVTVGAGAAGFRDDFDAATLPGWVITDASTEITDGVLRLTNTTAGMPAVIERSLPAKLTSWEIKLSLGRAHEDAAVRTIFATSFPFLPFIAAEIGSGVVLEGQDTNFRLMAFDSQARQWFVIAATDTAVVQDSVGALSELSISIRGTELRIGMGDNELYYENLAGAPPGLTDLTGVGLAVIPYAQAVDRAALYDWIEVTGDLVSSDTSGAALSPATGGDARIYSAVSATPPSAAAVPRTLSEMWQRRESRD